MTMSTQAEKHSPEMDNPVSSFASGIMTLKGSWVGICIKFSMYDRKTKVMHWSPRAYKLLFQALNKYFQQLGKNAFMFRAEADPALVAGLPARHPYHTLLTEAPEITEDEIGTASLSTGLDRVEFADHGPTFELRPKYGDGRTESIFLHEYTALSLLGYLEQSIEAAKLLTGPAAGNA